uniref:Uncharacterized protein LOC104247189 n=1 Tax=Nicotiana sylvestris TaxID=4096 RepID=A0A1U7YRJ9_NICSY|nr:PREDICTED: uncharacterized protein LOC104247189 [Nicotiana sylvestris]
MSSSGEALSQGSTNNNNDQNNVDSTSAEIESSSATVSADPPVQQQRQILFGSFLDQNAPTKADEFNMLVLNLKRNNLLLKSYEDNMGSVSQGNKAVPRPEINQHPELNFTLGPNLSLGGHNANTIQAPLPAAGGLLANSARVNHPRGRMPLIGSSSRSGKAVVEGENKAKQNSQPRRDSPWVRRPITNRLYDPSFAARGEPVDPHLRMLKQNPSFCTTPKERK